MKKDVFIPSTSTECSPWWLLSKHSVHLPAAGTEVITPVLGFLMLIQDARESRDIASIRNFKKMRLGRSLHNFKQKI